MGYVCTKCHNDPTQYPDNPHATVMSHGPCEDCGVVGDCYSCKCYRLRSPNKPKTLGQILGPSDWSGAQVSDGDWKGRTT